MIYVSVVLLVSMLIIGAVYHRSEIAAVKKRYERLKSVYDGLLASYMTLHSDYAEMNAEYETMKFDMSVAKQKPKKRGKLTTGGRKS